jgi:hypothetical protein
MKNLVFVIKQQCKHKEGICFTYLYHTWHLKALPSCHWCQGRCCPQYSAIHAHHYEAA